MKFLPLLLSSVASLSSATVFSADPIDLSTKWETPPTSRQILNSGDYYFSTDYTFGTGGYLSLKFNSTLVATDRNIAMDGFLLYPESNPALTLTGGTYDFRSAGGLNLEQNWSLDKSDRRVVFDGVTIKNCTAFFGPGGRRDNFAIIFTNSSSVAVSKSGGYDIVADGWGYRVEESLVEFNTGSTLSSDHSFMTDRNTKTDVLQKDILRFRGEGSSLTLTGADFYIGTKAPGHRVEFVDGARFNGRDCWLGRQSDAQCTTLGSNTLWVANSAVVNLTGAVQLGMSSYSYGYNALVVSNATLNMTKGYLDIGYQNGNNRALLCGEDTVGNVKGIRLGADAGGCSNVLEIADGATISEMPGNLTLGNVAGADGNVAVIRDGASLTTSSAVLIGHHGSNNRVVISNATVRTTQFQLDYMEGTHGNSLKIAGANADVKLTSNFYEPFNFRRANGASVELSDHAVFGKDKDGIWLHDCFSLGSSATNCLLRVTDGAELYTDRYIWPTSRGTNRIEVTNGG